MTEEVGDWSDIVLFPSKKKGSTVFFAHPNEEDNELINPDPVLVVSSLCLSEVLKGPVMFPVDLLYGLLFLFE